MVRSHFSDLYVVCCWFYRGGAASSSRGAKRKTKRNTTSWNQRSKSQIENARHRYNFIICPYYSSPNLKQQLLYLQHISSCSHNSNSIGKQRPNSWRWWSWWPEWWLGLDTSEWWNCNNESTPSDHLNNFP